MLKESGRATRLQLRRFKEGEEASWRVRLLVSLVSERAAVAGELR